MSNNNSNPDDPKNKYLPSLPRWRRLLKRLQTESISWPGCFFYNAVSTTSIFQKHYELTAKDITKYCSKGKLLDIGTGPGWLLLKLHKLAPSLKVTGMDILKKALANIARAKVSANILLEQGSADLLPYADNSFDIVISTRSLHHWKNPVRGFNEIFRILKDDGRARIYDIVTDIPSAVFKTVRKCNYLVMVYFCSSLGTYHLMKLYSRPMGAGWMPRKRLWVMIRASGT